MTIAARSTRSRTSRFGEALVCLLFGLAASYFVATTFCAIANFAWRQPMFDQWREYETLFGMPFPQNVVQLANGHRPILPNLVRVAEIRWFDADQLLQILVGGLCAFLSAAILAATAWYERSLPRVARYAAVMLCVLGVLWLANARRLLHGSEALHGYMPTIAAIGATCFMYSARRRDSVAWVAAASMACAIATFSFGLGLASFGSVLALGLLLRLPLRWLALPLTMLVLCLALYVFILPGNDAVREQLRVEPLEIIRVTAQWIGSPWNAGWLQFASDPSPPVTWHSLPQHALALSASVILVNLGIGVDDACMVLGLAGLGLFCACALRIYLRNDAVTRLEALALGTGIYALASALITVLGRLQYLHEHPDQIYADRYLLWPSLFWCCLAMLLLAAGARQRSVGVRAMGVVALLALPLALVVSQNGNAIWGAIVYRGAQQTAAALRSGVYDEEHFPGEVRDRETNLREIALLRSKQVAMFAEPAWQRLGTRWSGSLDTTADMAVEMRWLSPVHDPTASRPAAHLEGWATHGVAMLQRSGQLVILSGDGFIAGFAEFSFTRPNGRSLLLDVPRKRGFDGYIADYDGGNKYTLAVVDFNSNRAIALAELPVPPPAPGP